MESHEKDKQNQLFPFSGCFLFSFVSCFGETKNSVSEGRSKQAQANFFQILTDDQGWGDLGSFGHVFIETPNIDKFLDDVEGFVNE